MIKKNLYYAAMLAAVSSISSLQAHAETIFGVTTDNKLVRFESEDPSVLTDSVNITGLQNSELVAGIDFRPSSNVLYALGTTGRIYTVNTTTGAVTQVGNPLTLTGASFGFDFNPTADKIRVVSDTDENVRVDPDTGAVVSTDTGLTYDAADANNGANPFISGAAYTSNSVSQSVTTLFGIDTTLNNFVRQGSPNGSPSSPNTGLLFTIGSLGVDPTAAAGFDIAEARSGVALAAFTLTGESTSKLYSIDLGGGHATLVGTIGGTAAVADIAISRAGSVHLDQATYAVDEGAGNLTVTLSREGGTANPLSSGTPVPITVNISTADGTATASSDYTAVNQAVSFNDGERTKTVAIPIVNDAVGEANETFNIRLTSTTGGLLVKGTGTSVATILDNDGGLDTTDPTIVVDVERFIDESEFVRRGLPVQVVCSEDCTVTLTLTISNGNAKRFKLNSTTLSSTDFTREASEEKRAKVKPSKAVGAKLQSKPGALPATLTITAVDGSGNATTKTKKVTIK